jgi:hypothetical protein
MRRITLFRKNTFLAVAASLALLGVRALPAYPQDQAQAVPASAPNQVASGTHFLAGLDETLSTSEAKAGDRFMARTLEPLIAADGTVLRPGALIRGHVDRVDAAHAAGRARIWLTFDDIRTPDGELPLVAVVTDIPGVHSVRVDYSKEGAIETQTSKRQEEAQAAAEGALVGAAPGVVAKNKKDAAMGAAAGAATAFMVASGLGQEVTLLKDTKIELVLERPLYFGQ